MFSKAYENYFKAKEDLKKKELTAAGFAGISAASIYLFRKLKVGHWKDFTLQKFDTGVNAFPTDTEHVVNNVRITPKPGLIPGSLASERLIEFTKENAKFNLEGACQIIRTGDRFFHANRIPNPWLVASVLSVTTILSGSVAFTMLTWEIPDARLRKERRKSALYD